MSKTAIDVQIKAAGATYVHGVYTVYRSYNNMRMIQSFIPAARSGPSFIAASAVAGDEFTAAGGCPPIEIYEFSGSHRGHGCMKL
jgi:hypothetical protein